MKKRRNPVRELPISERERERIRGEVNSLFSGRGRAVRKALAVVELLRAVRGR